MVRRPVWGLVCSVFLLPPLAVLAAPPDSPAGLDLFEKKIRPVLVASCYECHSAGAKELKGGLLLDTKAGMRKGGDQGPAVVPGDLKSSLIVTALRQTDPDLKMPPKGKLPDAVIADFEAWIKFGAPDPRAGEAKPAYKPIDLVEGRKFWSFQPLVDAKEPAVKTAAWARSPIDRFVLAELEAKGLKPAADADARTLCRRLYLDLTGLPPTPEEVKAFEEAHKNDAKKAVEQLIDKLLGSAAFGEKWGRHWLDVARYAESNGNVDNFLFPHAWRYRDWVIDAFNRDLPFDQFVTEQIAGDLLESQTAAERDRRLVATGFLALTSKPRPQNNPDYAMDLVADQIDVTTQAVLGLTVACARCHDHKFDPVPQSEYYALAGIFTSTEMLSAGKGGNKKPVGNQRYAGGAGLHALTGAGDQAGKAEAWQKEMDRLDAELTAAKADLAKLQPAKDSAKPNKPAKLAAVAEEFQSELQQLRKQLKQQGLKAPEIKAKVEERLAELQKQAKKEGKKKPAAEAPAESAPAASPASAARLDEIKKQVAALEERRTAHAMAQPQASGLAMGVRDGKPADTQICIRGESQKRGDTMPRGFVTVASPKEKITINPQQSGRLELAQWLTSPTNPLTARVYANRIWHHLFGAGVVRTPDNFGLHGERPTHPALLDWLAARLIANGWSTKKMIREIVTSRTYQLGGAFDAQAYEIDPDNRLLWRHAPRRMEAEQVRDAVLAVSGQLDRSPLAGSLVSEYGEQEMKNQITEKIAGLGHQHRSVYLPAVRNATPEALEIFDVADASLVVGARQQTTVPSQMLFLMNSKFITASAASLAAKTKEAEGDAARVQRLYQLALQRKASDSEVNRVLAFAAEAKQKLGDKTSVAEDRVWNAVAQALLASAEFRYIE